ncbi:Cell morphogenesis N-terminal family protein [Brugia pahangi]
MKEDKDTVKKTLLRRRSDPTSSHIGTLDAVVAAELPWGSLKVVTTTGVDFASPPGHFAVKSLLQELFIVFDRRIQSIEDGDIERNINKALQIGEDTYVENLLRVLNTLCEHCLPSVLATLVSWYEKQLDRFKELSEKTAKSDEQRLAINYLFCIVLIEVLPQLHFFPTICDNSVSYIVALAFDEVAYRDIATYGSNYNNYLLVAERYAEVLGVLSQTHAVLIQRTFLSTLDELRKENPMTPFGMNCIIALLMAMKFYRIKTNDIIEFEIGVRFLDELGQYYLDVKQKDIKHAIAGLLVEILLPVAAQIKTEANIPAVISFVDKLYAPTFELVNKKRDKMAAYPLLTCLLCISQSKFFLMNWAQFLNSTLASLKNKDPKVSRVALESLYRLLWVYVIRNNCEGNTTTRNRLESICNSLFPKGNRAIVPRDAPLNIFVKIIHFIAQQKLDFAFREIIFDLLGCNRAHSVLKSSIYPERMNIGIRALMVIANSLQQKEGPPDMPRSMTLSSSQRLKKTYISRPLTAEIARSIGIELYYAPCRRAFDSILRSLDSQVGKPLMMTAAHTRGKEPEELLTGDVRPKLDLYRTCIAAIPRLLPESMSHSELVELLVRMNVHIDEELRVHAAQTLQALMSECAEWREDIVHSFLNYMTTQFSDTYPLLLDSLLRLLHQLLFTWKTAAYMEKKREMSGSSERDSGFINPLRMQISPMLTNSIAIALHAVEGFALAMMCQYRTQSRKISINILKEVRHLLTLVASQQHDTPVIEVLDSATSYVINKYIEHVPLYERQSWNHDFSSASDKIASIETDSCLVNSDRGNEYFRWDPWASALSGYCEHRFLLTQCPTAVFHAWPVVQARLSACSSFVDPNNPQNENRASLLRSSKSKATASPLCGESLGQDSYLSLWQKYLVMACALAPPHTDYTATHSRGFSPTSSIDNDVFRSLASSVRVPRPSAAVNATFFQKVVTMLRWDHMTDMRDSVVLGIGSTNPLSFEALLDEMKGLLREVMDRKNDNNARRKKRKDLLRLQIIRILQVATFRGVLQCSGCIDVESGLCSVLVDFLDSMRQNLESDQDRDMLLLTNLRLHFAKTMAMIINSITPEKRRNLLGNNLKQNLFFLFTSWCSRSIASDKRHDGNVGTYVEQRAVEAMCALLCCGPIFEPIKSIGEDGYLYGWLEALLDSSNPVLEKLFESTLSIMLDLNDETSQLLEWTINVCYSKPAYVAAKSFRSLVMLFSRREYPCEFDSLFVLCQMLAGDSDTRVSELAVQLLHLLRRQFLDDSLTIPNLTNLHNFSSNQIEVCRLLAKTYPKITMSVFSEVCSRVENAKCNRKTAILSLLSAWLENVQLVDPQEENATDESNGVKPGWGSTEATQLILNNLLYLTATLSDKHVKEISLLWNTLAISHPANLSIIINYLFVMASLSPDILLPYTKRVCCLLMDSNAHNLLKILMNDMDCINEQFKANLERCEMPPFYRFQNTLETAHEKHAVAKMKETTSCTAEVDSTSPLKINASDEDTVSIIHDLPMPAYGGHYSKLSSFLPATTQPVLLFTKSSVALLHVTDLLRCSSSEEWCDHIPLLLHIAVLGLDSLRPLICHHSRQLIINIILLQSGEIVSASQLSNILLTNQINWGDQASITSSADDSRTDSVARGETPTFSKMKCNEYQQMLLGNNGLFSTTSDLIQAFICCLSDKMDKPLWANEDVTPRQWRIESAAQLECMVRHLAELLIEAIPNLALRWSQLSMGMALSTSNRHIAGRCFQINSALCQSLSSWIPNILSRLAETIGEPHEETQSYITDIMLCLQIAVSHLILIPHAPNIVQCPTHTRSTSYTPAVLHQISNAALSTVLSPTRERKDMRHSVLVTNDREVPTGLSRSKSATALKTMDVGAGEENFSTLCQLFLIAVAMLESNFDNEYLLALHLLDKVFDTAASDKALCLQRLSKTVSQLDWKNYSGIAGLIVKGATIQSGYELSLSLLLKCLEVIDEPAMGPCSLIPLLITSSMPLLLLNFETPTPLCLLITRKLTEFLSERITETEEQSVDNPLSHLSSMMYKYSERCFPRDRFQWAKCVFKYMYDGLTPDHTQLFVLLAEMLERSITSLHTYILSCLHLLAGNADLSRCSPLSLNAQVIRVVSKHLQGPNWKDASKILKCFVQYDSVAIDGHISDGPESDEVARPEGLQLEVPLRGCFIPSTLHKSTPETASLRKHTTCNQIKVRERLISLLNASGLRVGLPKSASVIFSQSLHDISYEPPNSNSTSTERISPSYVGDAESASSLAVDQSVTSSFPRVFREFDFLEAEHDTVSESTESCFNWLSTIRPHSISKVGIDVEEQYQDDECTEIAGDQRPSSAASDSLEVSSERTPLESGIRSESVSEEESCEEELDEFAIDDEKLRMADMSSLAESIRCSHSVASVENVPLKRPPLFLQCNHHASTQGEHQWLSSFVDLSADESGDLTAHATLLFTQLYRECCLKLSGILRDASQVLSTSHHEISVQFSEALDLVLKIFDCPFLFVTAQHLRNIEMLSQQKCLLLELHEHYEIFVERKEQCIRALNAIKATMKLALIGGPSLSAITSNQYLELCRSVHKLFFQLLQITDKFDEMVKSIVNASDVQNADISAEVLCLHRCLLASIPDSVHGLENGISNATIESNTDALLMLMQKKQYRNALHLLRQLRQQFGAEYGCCDQVDVEVLLLIYCRNYQNSCWAILGSDKALTLSCNQLRQSNMQMSTIVRAIAPEALNLRSSRVSSASESYRS